MKFGWLASAGALCALAVTAASPPPPVAVTCPAETKRRGFLPPEGFEQWCERVQDGGVTRHGSYRAWHANQQPFIEADYCAGKRCGRYAEWFASGRPKSLGTFDRVGRYQGHWVFWTEDGASIEQDFDDGKLVRTTALPAPDGGLFVVVKADAGAPPRAQAPAAQDAGPHVTVVVNSLPEVPSNPPGVNPGAGVGGSAPPMPPRVPVPTGAVVCPPASVPGGEPFPAGLVQWCMLRDIYGRWVRHGVMREWYPNGQRRSESDYFHGRVTGWVTRWYPNGQKAEETHYRGGVPDGRSARWAEDGTFLGSDLFLDGRRSEVLEPAEPRFPAPPPP
jgi:antitoxin component YwqK of YwqJK toxin-antitoxin module